MKATNAVKLAAILTLREADALKKGTVLATFFSQ